MSRNRQARNLRSPRGGQGTRRSNWCSISIRYVPALITFIANKLSRSATVLYQKRFAGERHGVAHPGAARRSSRKFPPRASAKSSASTKARSAARWRPWKNAGLVAIKPDREDGRTYSISLSAKGAATH
jgi:hypothetical protein